MAQTGAARSQLLATLAPPHAAGRRREHSLKGWPSAPYGSINQPAGLGKTPSPGRSHSQAAPLAYLFGVSTCDHRGAQWDPDPGFKGAPISDTR